MALQALLGSSVGIVAVPAIAVNTRMNESQAASGNALSGMIVLPDKSNIPDGYVPASGAKVYITDLALEVSTDVNGRFEFNKVPVGEYPLKVEYTTTTDTTYTSIQQPVVVSDPNLATDHFTGFKILPEGEMVLSLRKGIQQVPKATFFFSTYGLDPNGIVIAPPATWSVNSPNTNTVIDSSGVFTSTEAGTYKVTATTSNGSASATVVVLDGVINIKGHIKDTGGNALSGATVSVKSTNLYNKSDTNGYYQIIGVPASDTVTLVVTSPSGIVVEQVVNVGGLTDVTVDINISNNPTVKPSPGLTPTPGGLTPTVTPTGTPSGSSTPTGTPTSSVPAPSMVSIAGGTFNMGSNVNALNKPVHSVTVSSFYMGTYQVTTTDYCRFLNSQGNQTEGGVTWISTGPYAITGGPDPGTFTVTSGYENVPVSCVSWYGAVAYCNWMSSQFGLQQCYGPYSSDGSQRWGSNAVNFHREYNGYRLPTEAENEYACRAGSTTEYFWGQAYDPNTGLPCDPNTGIDDPNTINNYCWYKGDSAVTLHNVGLLLPNPWGLYDIRGNVYEWCNDWSVNNYSADSVTDPIGPLSGTYRIRRGSNCYFVATTCRSADRASYDSTGRLNYLGFRLVKTGL